jgi:hypothetical protein
MGRHDSVAIVLSQPIAMAPGWLPRKTAER